MMLVQLLGTSNPMLEAALRCSNWLFPLSFHHTIVDR